MFAEWSDLDVMREDDEPKKEEGWSNGVVAATAAAAVPVGSSEGEWSASSFSVTHSDSEVDSIFLTVS